MVGLKEEEIIEQFLYNDYIISPNKSFYKKHKFLFINKIYRLDFDFGGIIKINKKNLKEQTVNVNFKEIYVYFESPSEKHSLRVQLKHFMECFNFYFPNAKRHIILEKKM